jgi:hypothetical protein
MMVSKTQENVNPVKGILSDILITSQKVPKFLFKSEVYDRPKQPRDITATKSYLNLICLQ